MKPKIVRISFCLTFVLAIATNGFGKPPTLKEVMIDSEDTGTWKTDYRKARVPWEFSFGADGKFTAVARGEVTHINRFSRTKKIDWKQEATGTWALEEGSKFRLKLTITDLETTGDSAIPTQEELKRSGEFLYGMSPYEKDAVKGEASFELLESETTPQRLVWVHQTGKKAFADTPDVSTNAKMKKFRANVNFIQNVTMLILEQAD